jgi:hypothetical protein
VSIVENVVYQQRGVFHRIRQSASFWIAM